MVTLHFEAPDAHIVVGGDAALLARDLELVFDRVDAFEVGQQKPLAASRLDDDAVALRVEILRGVVDQFRLCENVDEKRGSWRAAETAL